MPRKQQHRRDGIYQRKDRPGFWVSYTNTNGRRVQQKLQNAYTLQQAQAELTRIKDRTKYEKDHGVSAPSVERFEDFAKEFLDHQKKRISKEVTRGKVSQAEFDRQQGIVNKHLTAHFGTMRLGSIRKKDVGAYIDSRMGTVGDGTIIKECNVLKRLFSVAMEREKIAVNPVKGAPIPKAPDGRVRYLTPAELQAILVACPEWLRPVVGLLVTLGARRGELLKVTWSDVDLDRNEIRLRHTKSGKERLAYVNELAGSVLASMTSGDEEGRRGLLFPERTPSQVSVAFGRAVKQAKVENFTLHDLRHHFASMLRQHSVDLHTIQKLLGHSDPRMTDRYAHLSQEFLLNASRKLEGVVSLALPVPGNDSGNDGTGKRGQTGASQYKQ